MTHDQSMEIKKILGQLLTYTTQLTQWENDPGVDAAALARSCAKQLAVLRELIPPGIMQGAGGADSEDRRQIVEMLQAVDVHARHCIRTLEAARGQVVQQMGSLRRSRRAIQAYGGK